MIVFDDMIADMLSNKKLNPIVTELFIRSRKLNISLVFITESYTAVTKNVRLNSLRKFIIKIPNKLHSIIHQILILESLRSLRKMYFRSYFFGD